jgi:hypothetical protein
VQLALGFNARDPDPRGPRSVAYLAVIRVQDLLSLGFQKGRPNTAGTVSCNWPWTLPAGVLTANVAGHVFPRNQMYGRT